MSEARRIDLTVLGQSLTVRTEASPEYVRTLADYLERRVDTLRRSGVRDGSTALVLAALDIADELFRAREERAHLERDVGSRLGALTAALERLTP